MSWPVATVLHALELKRSGLTDAEVAFRLGLPYHAVRNWSSGRVPKRVRAYATGIRFCERCGARRHDYGSLPKRTYAYLLAVYLGDGYLARHARDVYSLRLTLDAEYQAIVREVGRAIKRVRGRWPHTARDRHKRCMRITSYWKQWPCLLPQHGPARKHSRPIELTDWQRAIVESDPRPFLRGLIHTDGWRGVNRVHVKGRDYAYPRYQFSNRSNDIRRLFTDACDLLGVEWRPWGPFHISVARRDSVAILDSFIGLKH
jgi:hypothetical protein